MEGTPVNRHTPPGQSSYASGTPTPNSISGNANRNNRNNSQTRYDIAGKSEMSASGNTSLKALTEVPREGPYGKYYRCHREILQKRDPLHNFSTESPGIAPSSLTSRTQSAVVTSECGEDNVKVSKTKLLAFFAAASNNTAPSRTESPQTFTAEVSVQELCRAPAPQSKTVHFDDNVQFEDGDQEREEPDPRPKKHDKWARLRAKFLPSKEPRIKLRKD